MNKLNIETLRALYGDSYTDEELMQIADRGASTVEPPIEQYTDELFSPWTNPSRTQGRFRGNTPDVESYRDYGVNYNPDSEINDDLRARNQSGWEQFANASKRIIPNTFFEIIGGTAAALDIFDYMVGDDEVGNAISDWANEQKEKTNERNPIYQEADSGMGDWSWWMENGSSLVTSAAGFAVTGAAIGRGISSVKWLSALTNSRKGLNYGQKAAKGVDAAMDVNKSVDAASRFLTAPRGKSASKLQQFGNQLTTSTMLTQAESISSATQIFDSTYEEAIGRGFTDQRAKELAAKAAAHTINVNRANIALNLTSAGMFTKSAKALSNAGRPTSWGKGLMGKYSKDSKLGALGVFKGSDEYDNILRTGFLEGTQESMEELVNLYAEQRGEEKGSRLLDGKSSYGALRDVSQIGDILGNIFTKEGIEAATLGFLGGLGQTAFTKGVIDNIGGNALTGSKVAAVDNQGNKIIDKKDKVYGADVEVKSGDYLGYDFKVGDEVKIPEGTQVTADNLRELGPIKHTKGSKVYNKEGNVVVENTQKFEEKGKYLSANKAKKIKLEQKRNWVEANTGVAKKSLDAMKAAQEQGHEFLALQAIDTLIDPLSNPDLKNHQRAAYAEYILLQEGNLPTDEDARNMAIIDKTAELTKLSTSELLKRREEASSKMLGNQIWQAFNSGNKDTLIGIYQDIANLDAEKAEAEGMDSSYKELAEKAIDKINEYENLYLDYTGKYDEETAKSIFHNRIYSDYLYDDLNNENKNYEDKKAEIETKADILDIFNKKVEIEGRREGELAQVNARIDELKKQSAELEKLKVGEGVSKEGTRTAQDISDSLAKLRETRKSKEDGFDKELSDLGESKELEDLRFIQNKQKKAVDKINKNTEIFKKLRDGKSSLSSMKKDISYRKMLSKIVRNKILNDLVKMQNSDTHVITFNLESDDITMMATSLRANYGNPAEGLQILNPEMSDAELNLKHSKVLSSRKGKQITINDQTGFMKMIDGKHVFVIEPQPFFYLSLLDKDVAKYEEAVYPDGSPVYTVEYEGRNAKISREGTQIRITPALFNNLRVHSAKDFKSMKLKRDLNNVKKSRNARLNKLIRQKDNLTDKKGDSIIKELETLIDSLEEEISNIQSTNIDQITDKNLIKIVENVVKKATGEYRRILERDDVANFTADQIREYFEPEVRIINDEERTVALKIKKTGIKEEIVNDEEGIEEIKNITGQSIVDDSEQYQQEYADTITLSKDGLKVDSFKASEAIALLKKVLKKYGLPVKSVTHSTGFKLQIELTDGYVIDFGSILGGAIGKSLPKLSRVDSIPGLIVDIINHDKELSAKSITKALKSIAKALIEKVFPDSKVQKELYHGTKNEFESFEVGEDGAIHFGDEKAAKDRVKQGSGNKAIKKVKLNIENPVEGVDSVDFDGTRTDKDSAEFIVDKLEIAEKESQEHLIALFANEKITKEQLEQYWDKSLKEIYKDLFNADGYYYINKAENKGSTSYVVFDSNQISIIDQNINKPTQQSSTEEDNTFKTPSTVLPKSLFKGFRAGVNRNSKIRQRIEELKNKIVDDASLEGYLKELTDEIDVLNEFVETADVLSETESENLNKTLNKLEAERDKIQKLYDNAGALSETADQLLNVEFDSEKEIDDINKVINALKEAYGDVEKLVAEEMESQRAKFEQEAEKKREAIIDTQTPEEPTMEQMREEDSSAQTLLAPFTPGKTAGVHLEWVSSEDPDTLVFVKKTSLDDNGLPIVNKNTHAQQWFNALNKIASGNVDGVNEHNTMLRFVTASDPLVGERLFLTNEQSSEMKKMGLDVKDDGTVHVTDSKALDNYLETQFNDISDEDKDAVKKAAEAFKAKNSLTIADMDLMFRYRESVNGVDVDMSNNRIRGEGIYAILATTKGVPLKFNDESTELSDSGDIRFTTIANAPSKNSFQIRNNIARYYAQDRNQTPLDWVDLKEQLLREYKGVKKDSALSDIIISIKGTNDETVEFTAADVDAAEKLDNLPNDVKLVVEERLNVEISGIRAQRLKILNDAKLGKTVISTVFNISDGIAVKLERANLPIVGPKSFVEDVSQITEMVIPLTKGVIVFPKSGTNSTTRKADRGDVILKSDNGTFIKAARRAVTDEEADLILSLINIEYENGITNERVSITSVVDEDGNSKNIRIPIIRHKGGRDEKGQRDKEGPKSVINRIIGWTGPTRDRKPYTIYFDINPLDGLKQYLYYGENEEVSMEDLATNEEEQFKFKKWLKENRKHTVNRNFNNESEYLHPISVTKRGNEYIMKARSYKKTDHSIPYIAYLADAEVLESNTISRAESESVGMDGAQTASRYVDFGESHDITSVTKDGNYDQKAPEQTEKFFEDKGLERKDNSLTDKTVEITMGDESLVGTLRGEFSDPDGVTIYQIVDVEGVLHSFKDVNNTYNLKPGYFTKVHPEIVVKLDEFTFKGFGKINADEIFISQEIKYAGNTYETSFVFKKRGVIMTPVKHAANKVIVKNADNKAGKESDTAKDTIFGYLNDPGHNFFKTTMRTYFEEAIKPENQMQGKTIDNGWPEEYHKDEEISEKFIKSTKIISMVINPRFNKTVKEAEKDLQNTESFTDIFNIIYKLETEDDSRKESVQSLISEIRPDFEKIKIVFTDGNFTAKFKDNDPNKIYIGARFDDDKYHGNRDLILLHEVVHSATMDSIIKNIKGKLKGDKKEAVDNLISHRNKVLGRVLRNDIDFTANLGVGIFGNGYRQYADEINEVVLSFQEAHLNEGTNSTAEDLFNKLKEDAIIPANSIHFLENDVVEFVSYVFENEALQDALNEMENEDKVTLLQRIIDAISEILGIEINKDSLLYKAILDVKVIAKKDVKIEGEAKSKVTEIKTKTETDKKKFTKESLPETDLKDSLPTVDNVTKDENKLSDKEIEEINIGGLGNEGDYPDFSKNQMEAYVEFLNDPEENFDRFLKEIGFFTEEENRAEFLQDVLNYINEFTDEVNSGSKKLDAIISNLVAIDKNHNINRITIEQVSMVELENGYILESLATRSIMNSLTKGVIEELVVNQRDPVKIIEGIQDLNKLQGVYDKSFNSLIKDIDARMKSVKDTDIDLYNNLKEVREALEIKANRDKLSELHAILELRSYDIKIDEENYSEFQKTGDYNSYKDSITFNTKDMAPAVIKLLIASTPKLGMKFDASLSIEEAKASGYGYMLTDKLIKTYEDAAERIKGQIAKLEDQEYLSPIQKRNLQSKRLKLSGIQKSVKLGQVVEFDNFKDNLFGTNELEDFERVYNFLQKNLANLPSDFTVIKETLDKLATRQLSSDKGIYGLEKMMATLSKIAKLDSAAGVAIRNEFLQTFSKARMTHYITLLNEEGNIYATNANRNTEAGILIREWRSNLMENLKNFNEKISKDPVMFTTEFRDELVNVGRKLQIDGKRVSAEEAGQYMFEQLGIVSNNFAEVNNELIKNGTSAITLANNILENMSEEVVDLKIDIYNSKSKVRGTIVSIANTHVDLQNDVIENQHIDPTGNTVHSISQKHGLNTATAKLNYISNRVNREERLRGLKAEMPHLHNPYTGHSLFKEAILEGDTINTAVIAGVRAEQMGLKGKKTSTLENADLYSQRFHDTLSGRFVIIQAADRGVTNQVTLNRGKTDETRLLFEDTNSAYAGFVGYLIDEINTAGIARKNIGKNPDFDLMYYKDKGGKLRHFSSIVNESTDAVEKLIEKVRKSGNLIGKEDIKEDVNDLIVSDLKKYFNDRVKEVKSQLDKFGLTDLSPMIEVDVDGVKSFVQQLNINGREVKSFIGIDNSMFREYVVDNPKMNHKQVLMHMIGLFVVNQEGAYIEQSKMFFGDPAMFEDEGDIYKRMSMYNSTKRVSANDAKLNIALNKNNNIFVKNEEGDTVRTLTEKEVDDYLKNNLKLEEGQTHDLGYSFRSDRKKFDGLIKTLIFDDNIALSSYADDKVVKTKVVKGVAEYTDKDGKKTEPSDIRRIFTNSFIKDGITNSDLLIGKVNAYMKPYLEIEEGDGQGYISLDEYKELMLRSGLQWKPKHQQVFEKVMNGERLTNDEMIIFPPLKTQYAGPLHGPDQGEYNTRLFVPSGYKHSLIPLIPSMVKGTQLEDLVNYMRKNQIGIAQYKSATKFGLKLNNGEVQPFYNDKGKLNVEGWSVTQDIYYEHMGIQLEIQPKLKGKITSATQPTKLVLSNAYENGRLREGYNRKDIEGYKELTSELTRRSMSKLLKEIDADPTTLKINNISKLVDVMMEEAKDRGSSDNVRKSLLFLAENLIRTSGVKGAYIEELLTRSKVENILNAIVNARVIRQKRNGEGMVQASSSGFEKSTRAGMLTTHPDLRFYEEGKKGTIPAEIMMPLPQAWMKWVEKEGGLESFNERVEKLVDTVWDSEKNGTKIELSEEDQNLLDMITVFAYRIPNQGLNSSDVFRIKRFLPSEAGLITIVPTEMVAKSGSDFDIDKLYTEIPSFRMVNGEPKYTNYVENFNNVDDDTSFRMYKDRINDEIPKSVISEIESSLFNESLADQREARSIYQETLSETIPEIKKAEIASDELYDEYSEKKQEVKDLKAKKRIDLTDGRSAFNNLNHKLKELYWHQQDIYKAEKASFLERTLGYSHMTHAILNMIESEKADKVIKNIGNVDILIPVEETKALMKRMIDDYNDVIRKLNVRNNILQKAIDEKNKAFADMQLVQTSKASTGDLIWDMTELLLQSKSIIRTFENALYDEIAATHSSLPFNDYNDYKKGKGKDINTISAIENKLIKHKKNITMLPTNLRQILAPIDDSDLRGIEKGVVWDIRFLNAADKDSGYYFDDGEKILKEYQDGNLSEKAGLKKYKEAFVKYQKTKSLTEVLSVVNNVSKFTAFLVGKRNIGIVARNITHHVLSQEVDLSSNWSIEIGSDGSMLNNASIFFDTNLVLQRKDSKVREKFDYKLSDLKRGTTAGRTDGWYVKKRGSEKRVLNPGDKLFVSFSSVTDTEGNYISETLSAFLNAYVDVARDPYAFDMNAGAENAPIFMYLIRAGVDLKWITRFMNQPVIKDYLGMSGKYSASFNRINDNVLYEKGIIGAVRSKYGKGVKFLTSTEFYSLKMEERRKALAALNPYSTPRTPFSKIPEGQTKDNITNMLNDYKTYLFEYNKWSKKGVNTLAENKAGAFEDKDGVANMDTGTYKPTADLMTSFKQNLLNHDALGDMLHRDPETLDKAQRGVFNSTQLNILELFLEIKRQTGAMRDASNVTAADTNGLPKDMATLKDMEDMSAKVSKEGQFFNLEKINEDTIISEMQNVVDLTNKLYTPLYRIYSNPDIENSIRGIKKTILDFSSRIGKDKVNSVLTSEFVNFVLHADFGQDTNVDSEYVYKSLLTDEEAKYNKKSLLAYISELQTNDNIDELTVTDPKGNVIIDKKAVNKLKRNSLIKELIYDGASVLSKWNDYRDKRFTLTSRDGKTSSFKGITPRDITPTLGIISRKMTTQRSNELIKAFAEIRDYAPELYKDLVQLSLAQNGVGNSYLSIHDLIPTEDFMKQSISQFNAFESLSEEQLEFFMEEFEIQFFSRRLDMIPKRRVRRSPEGVYFTADADEDYSAFPIVLEYRMDPISKEIYSTIYKREQASKTQVDYSKRVPSIGDRERFVGYRYNVLATNEEHEHNFQTEINATEMPDTQLDMFKKGPQLSYTKGSKGIGEEINSYASDLAFALTNPTVTSPKGKLWAESHFSSNTKKWRDYMANGINFEGKNYKDVEEAYQQNKDAYRLGAPRNNFMKELIKIKFETYPDLLSEIDKKGGVDYLTDSTHQPTKGSSYWETKGKNMFIELLTESYIEMTEQPKPDIIGLSEKFTRDSVKQDPEYLYLFTDNANRTSGRNLLDDDSGYATRYGKGLKYPGDSQAVIRGLNNAFPITTMVDQNKTQWSDDRLDEYKKIIDVEIKNIIDELPNFKGIKFSDQNPFGQGRFSKMREKAPKVWEYLNEALSSLGIDNAAHKGLPSVPKSSKSLDERVDEAINGRYVDWKGTAVKVGGIEPGNFGKLRTSFEKADGTTISIIGDTREEIINQIQDNYVRNDFDNNTNNIVGKIFDFNVGEDEKGDAYNHRVLIDKVSLLPNGDYHLYASNLVNGNKYDMITDSLGSVLSYTRNGKTFKGGINDEIMFTAGSFVESNRLSKISSPKFRIPMNFSDGTGGRKMRPEFAGKSTMDLFDDNTTPSLPEASNEATEGFGTITTYSGAAKGYDTIWEQISNEYQTRKHVNFTINTYNGLTPEQKKEVDNAYIAAVKVLKRPVLSDTTPGGKLMRRNYLQAKAGDAVFAISQIVEPGQRGPKGFLNNAGKQVVEGGTGNTVEMAIQLGRPVYVFDDVNNEWHVWDVDDNMFLQITTPELTEKPTLIGSRRTTKSGKNAARAVFNKTNKKFVDKDGSNTYESADYPIEASSRVQDDIKPEVTTPNKSEIDQIIQGFNDKSKECN